MCDDFKNTSVDDYPLRGVSRVISNTNKNKDLKNVIFVFYYCCYYSVIV